MNQLARYDQFYGTKVTIRGVAQTDAIYSTNSQLSFDLGKVEIQGDPSVVVPGVVNAQGFGTTTVNRGDVIEAQGKLRSAFGSKQGYISYAQLTVLGQSTSFVDKIRREFNAGMQSALPEPLASFALGLLIGQRNTLPKNTSAQLSAVGLTHLIAVSGYNLTILLAASRRLFGKRSKYQTTVLSLLMIGGFLLVTGLSSSIVRAALVSVLSLAAWYYGRTFRPLLLILLAAALTAGWNPLYIWSDIGWYLSFLAFFGVLILAPLVVQRLYGPDRQPRALTYLLIESVSAQIMTIPIILYTFQQVSLVALPANLLVVPLVPATMLLSFMAGLGGMFIPQIIGWLAMPVRILLTYMLDMVSVFARVPHALAERSLALLPMLGMYLVVVLDSLILWRKTKPKYGTITDIIQRKG